jgi:hypothetical protein
VILAISRDEETATFEIEHYGIVGNLFTVLPEIQNALGPKYARLSLAEFLNIGKTAI